MESRLNYAMFSCDSHGMSVIRMDINWLKGWCSRVGERWLELGEWSVWEVLGSGFWSGKSWWYLNIGSRWYWSWGVIRTFNGVVSVWKRTSKIQLHQSSAKWHVNKLFPLKMVRNSNGSVVIKITPPCNVRWQITLNISRVE